MYSVLKFQSPFERLKQYSNTPEVGLCKAIITQAIIDSTCNAGEGESRKERLEALWWLFGDDEEFIQICDGAQLEPCFVRKLAIEAMILKIKKDCKLEEKTKGAKKANKETLDKETID